MPGPARIAQGLLTDPRRPVSFRFDGRQLSGLAGDTLASALLASGRLLAGRSFKYHRPRGIVTAGPEEPCALVDLLTAAGREPNRLATTLPLSEGLRAESQNRWPSLRCDVLALNGALSAFLPAGFYYKTFMRPGWAWERLFEPLIRRAAGLGRLEAIVGRHAEPAEIVHDHADVLVVGAGSAGLAAALHLAGLGLRVLLSEQDSVLGGGTLLDPRWHAWRAHALGVLQRLPQLRALTRTCILGAYGQGVFGALERLEADESARFGGQRERLRVIRARRVLFACGATERLIAFANNDRPGVMLAGAALAYLRRYGVAVGERCAFFVNNDEAYEALFALRAAGVRVVGVVDRRAVSLAADRAAAAGVPVFRDSVVETVRGRARVRAVGFAQVSGGPRRHLVADALLVSGGHTPNAALATQLGAPLHWEAAIAGFVPALSPGLGALAGAARGEGGLAACAADGVRAARLLALELQAGAPPTADAQPFPPDERQTPLLALWDASKGPRGKAFVDLQNDVTVSDVHLAHREGYEHLEHMKRYTTHGMATDQGRIGGLLGAGVLAAARGVHISAVGQLKPRPYAQAVPFAALAGPEVREHYKPKRRLPLHAWHERAGATFVSTGLWLRPLVYGDAAGWEPVLAEARHVRRAVGITDVSTLGKLEVRGPDAARFLDFIYANTFSTLAVGRARYGIMLREDGMMMDDGTTSRLAADQFLVTTTTANASAVLEHMEFQLQANCPGLDVVLSDVTDQWAQFAVAGPRAREVVAAAVSGIELSNAGFPFMAAAAMELAGIPGRIFRISFSGELAYELAVPARQAETAWCALLAAGQPCQLRPYGLDALNTLRIEKGHITGAELNGNTTPADLGFARMLKAHGDFVGRHLAARPGLQAEERLQLVGVRCLSDARLRNGMHLLEGTAVGPGLGYITSSTPATADGRWLGLALLSGGRGRIGETLRASSPVHAESVPVRIVSPHMLDPENTRVRA
ncbi:MAG: (2Fe-2S)-binding protein [Proteobacteria bacterium]|nr:(2Fe-2S)-binding protein [Pseudomonadota bacterium]